MNDDLVQTGVGGEQLSAQTRERILDAGERLFAEKGLHDVSTREITKEARANIGAINYYFGGKQGLIMAVLTRRLTPLDEKRFAALETVEKAAGDGPPRIERILEALIRPLVEEAFNPKPGHSNFARLMGRVLGEAGETVDRLRQTHFVPLVQRFDAALHRANPGLSHEELFWRMVFIFGALHFMMLATYEPMPEWPHYELNAEIQIRRMVTFAAAGLRAAEGPAAMPHDRAEAAPV